MVMGRPLKLRPSFRTSPETYSIAEARRQHIHPQEKDKDQKERARGGGPGCRAGEGGVPAEMMKSFSEVVVPAEESS
jgi:hypothetical protein